jgi:hypothetical protein
MQAEAETSQQLPAVMHQIGQRMGSKFKYSRRTSTHLLDAMHCSMSTGPEAGLAL